MKYARKLSKRNSDVVNGCFVALNLTGKSTNYAVAPWRELVSVVDTLPSARWGRSNLWLPQLKTSHETRWMKEWWMVRVYLTAFYYFGTTVQMEAEEPEYQLEYAGPRYEGNPVPATEYEEPVNELEYAGPIYEPDSGTFVPQEFVFNGTIAPQILIDGRFLRCAHGVSPNLDAGPVDFPSDVLVNPIESAAGLDNFNMEDIFPNFDPQVFDFGSTYDLPPLPASPASSPPAPVVTEGMQSTRKRKTREPEVDVRNIIPESQGRARFRARVRAEGPE
ncbi:hypothetical protein B0H14DRAFT_2559651 [Mycena olivaceomarginata]|nr:hypothetical protein B0H14DRAFT_2559651 [Mycena olivaceomarginata]